MLHNFCNNQTRIISVGTAAVVFSALTFLLTGCGGGGVTALDNPPITGAEVTRDISIYPSPSPTVYAYPVETNDIASVSTSR